MKKISLFIFSVSVIFVSAFYFYTKTISKIDQNITDMSLKNYLLDHKNNPQAALIELLKLFNVQHDGTLKGIVKATQENWLRKPGKERWQIDEINVENKKAILFCIDKLNCIKEIKPSSNNYDYALMMGALACRIKMRLSYVMDLWKKGIRFKNLVFLVGERPRDMQQETEETFILSKDDGFDIKDNWTYNPNFEPKTETQLAKIIFDQIKLPDDFNAKVIFVDTPMQKNNDGTPRRPNTGDTVIEWQKLNPEPGRCLVISNNPYITYQDSVARTYLPKNFTIETVGSAASINEKIAIYLDSIARWLYQEQQFLNADKKI